MSGRAAGLAIASALIALVLVRAGWGQLPVAVLAVWLIVLAGLHALRFRQVRSMARAGVPSGAPRHGRIVWLAALTGLAAAAWVGFFPSLDAPARWLGTVALLVLVVVEMAACCGHTGVFVAAVAPVLLALAGGWSLAPLPAPGVIVWPVLVLLGAMAGASWVVVARDPRRAGAQGAGGDWMPDPLPRSPSSDPSTDTERSTAPNAGIGFLAAAGHDLHQSLQTLSMYGAALSLRKLDDKTALIAQGIEQAVADLTADLDALLDLARLDAGTLPTEPRPVDVGLFVQRVARAVQPAAQARGLELTAHTADSWWVLTDPALLERLLRSLLDDAIARTPSGAVTVSVGRVGGRCEIVIADTGPGIAADRLSHVFDPSHRAAGSDGAHRTGLGLGLAIAGRLAALLGAQLDVTAEPGPGSRFTVGLDCTEAPASADAAAVEHSRLRGVRVLVLEDDSGVRLGTTLLLEGIGCSVTATGDPDEALAALEGQPHDVVLADIHLHGGRDGVQTVARMRERSPGLPVVLITGERSGRARQEADQIGAPLLVKPVDQSTLIETIVRALEATGR